MLNLVSLPSQDSTTDFKLALQYCYVPNSPDGYGARVGNLAQDLLALAVAV